MICARSQAGSLRASFAKSTLSMRRNLADAMGKGNARRGSRQNILDATL
jgi:hypothetical protein